MAGAVGAAAAVAIVDRDGNAAEVALPSPAAGTGVARVERRDLVERETVNGTLGFADRATLTAVGSGTLTRMRPGGAVVRRGQWLYEADGARTAFLLYGRRPLWRTLRAGVEDGEDIRQLERNLVALGYDPGAVDDDWSAATTSAADDFQDDRGLDGDGAISLDEVIIRPGAVRIGEPKAQLGAQLRPGQPVAGASGTTREVAIALEATKQDIAGRGDRVTVTLSSGRELRGRVAEVGSVAEAGEEGTEPTIAVRVTLSGRGARLSGLDQAPVEVGLVRNRARNALTVPVLALVAMPGGYAVEVREGAARRLARVEPGLYADDRVAVTGGGMREGMRVAVPE